MKKRIVIAICLPLLFVSFNLFGQFSFSVKTGMNIATMKFTGTEYATLLQGERTEKAGFNIGGQLKTKVWNNLFVAGEILYISKGAVKLKNIDNFGYLEPGSVITLHYVEIPLLAKWQIKKMFEVGFGPGLSYLAKAVKKDDNGKMNATNSYKKIDVGVNGDFYYQANTNFGAGVRFTYGLNKANFDTDNSSDEIQYSLNHLVEGRNKTVQLYISCNF